MPEGKRQYILFIEDIVNAITYKRYIHRFIGEDKLNTGYIIDIYSNYLAVKNSLKVTRRSIKSPNALPSVRSTVPKTTYETILEFVSQMEC